MKIVPERHPFPQLREADGGASLLVQGTATEQEASGDYAYVGPLGFESKKHPGIISVFLRPGKWLLLNGICQLLQSGNQAKGESPTVQ